MLLHTGTGAQAGPCRRRSTREGADKINGHARLAFTLLQQAAESGHRSSRRSPELQAKRPEPLFEETTSSLYTANLQLPQQPVHSEAGCSANTTQCPHYKSAVARFLKFLVDAKYTSRLRLDATPQQSWGTFPSIPVLDPTSSSKRCNGICDNSEARSPTAYLSLRPCSDLSSMATSAVNGICDNLPQR